MKNEKHTIPKVRFTVRRWTETNWWRV